MSGDDDDSPGNLPTDPFAALFGGINPDDIGAAFAKIGQLLSWQGGPVNWDLAQQVARETISKSGDRSVGDADKRAIADAVRLADHWLDGATTLPAAAPAARAWSRAEWFEATLPVWRKLVEPVATHVVEAIGGALPQEAAAMSGPMLGMMRQVGGAMFGAQIGQALGSLAAEVVGSADIGLPLTATAQAALLPANVAAFGTGLGVDVDDVRLYLALREAAYVRLFAHVPWLAPRLVGAVEEYGRGITIDMSRLEEAVRDLDPMRPEALQDIFAEGMFAPSVTPAQQAALTRIETLLALIEGWVDAVVTSATADRLPSASALQEAIRRRRAAGGPAEQTFSTLVGLELRPRRLRDAAQLWSLLTERRGAHGRDGVWAHPDLLPSGEDLDDPEAFVLSTELEVDLTSFGDESTPRPTEPAAGANGASDDPDGSNAAEPPAGPART